MAWRIPTDEEIKTLEMYLGMSQTEADDTSYRGTDEGSKMAGYYDLWDDGDLRSNANFGLSNLDFPPAGFRSTSGSYYNLGAALFLWSSTPSSSTNAFRRELSTSYSTVYRDSLNRGYGFSVRCLRDATASEQSSYSDFQVLTDFYQGNDGTLYDCVKIGTQIWVAENLRETKYANGDTITLTTGDVGSETVPYRYIYNDDGTLTSPYGYLYNFAAVDDSRNMAGEDINQEISGIVKIGTTLISGATVRIINQTDNSYVTELTTDANGEFSYNVDSRKKYHVIVEYEDGTTQKYNAKSLWDIDPTNV